MLLPSETEQAQPWLTNFAPTHRHVAARLLDGLTFHGADRIRSGLIEVTEELLVNGKIQQPAAFFPVRDVRDLTLPEGCSRHTAYDTYDPGGALPVVIGSEGLIARVIRDITGVQARPKEGRLRPTSSLSDLRDSRCNSIVLMEENAGSGHQALQFYRTWPRHATIRSWQSGRQIAVHLVIYTATATATALLERATSTERLHTVRTSPDLFTAPWDEYDRAQVVQLCLDYAHASWRGNALGYKQSASLTLTPTVPNNLPAILLQNEGPQHEGEPWVPLFNKREFPAAMQQTFIGYAPSPDHSLMAAHLGQTRLAKRLERHRSRPAEAMLIILAALALARFDRDVYAAKLGRTTAEVEKLLSSLLALGLVDSDFTLTTAGRAELSISKRLPRGVPPPPDNPEEPPPYYPQQLR